MAKITWKGSTLLAPVPPVMVTCGDMENANIITVAWAGIINTHPPRVSVSIRPTRHSYGIIKERGEFVINLTPASLVKECDYCGIYTGAKVDKFQKTGLHKAPASAVAAPLIEECPLALECKVLEVIPQGTHDLFLAEVVAVDADDSLLDENGKLCLERAHLAAFAHGEYFALGDVIGRFGFSAAKPGRQMHPTHTAPEKTAPAKTATDKLTSSKTVADKLTSSKTATDKPLLSKSSPEKPASARRTAQPAGRRGPTAKASKKGRRPTHKG